MLFAGPVLAEETGTDLATQPATTMNEVNPAQNPQETPLEQDSAGPSDKSGEELQADSSPNASGQGEESDNPKTPDEAEETGTEPSSSSGESEEEPVPQVTPDEQSDPKAETSTKPTTKPVSPAPSISYKSSLQKSGWQKPVSNGQTSGKVGKTIEGIKISLKSTISGGISYKTQLQTYGWQKWVSNGATSGKLSKHKRIEAIAVKLTGKVASQYNLYYRTRVQSLGWLGWAKNGAAAGTKGLSKRVETYQIKLVKKGIAFKTGGQAFYTLAKPSVTYRAYVQGKGWQKTVSQGKVAGTVKQSRRLEGLKIYIKGNPSKLGGIRYRSFVRGKWQQYVTSGNLAGTEKRSTRMEAVRIRLTGVLTEHYSIAYRAHIQGKGWLKWVKDSQTAGSTGKGKRLEAIEIRIIKRGAPLPKTKTSAQLLSNNLLKKRKTPLYKQTDARWAYRYYGLGNMAQTGCLPTSIAMVATTLTGKTVLPTDVANYLYYHTPYFNRRVIGTDAEGVVKAAGHYGLKGTALHSYQSLETALKEGYHVVAVINVGGGYTHGIVLTNYKNGQVYVRDPLYNFRTGWNSLRSLYNQRSSDPDDRLGNNLPFTKIVKNTTSRT